MALLLLLLLLLLQLFPGSSTLLMSKLGSHAGHLLLLLTARSASCRHCGS